MCLPLDYRESLLLSFFVPHVSLVCCTLLLSILDSLTQFFLLLFLFSFDNTLLCNMCERLGLKRWNKTAAADVGHDFCSLSRNYTEKD